jgi:hypothetical protein
VRDVITGLCVLLLTLQTHTTHATRTAMSANPQIGVIRVWKVGSPFSRVLPQTTVAPTLQHLAESLGYAIEVEAFSGAGFGAKFSEALGQHNEPEVIAFDNFAVLIGGTTGLAHVDGILADARVPSDLARVHESLGSLQPRGWVMLVRSARNYEAAKALVLRKPECNPTFDRTINGITPDELRLAQETAVASARAYLGCDSPLLASLSDEAKLGNQCFLPNAYSRVNTIDVCSVSGNRNLIFVRLISSFEGERRVLSTDRKNYANWRPAAELGHQSLLAVLRRSDIGWRLLAITDDPLDLDPSTFLNIRQLSALLGNGSENEEAAAPAQLVTENGVYPAPAAGKRFGDFVWRPGTSANVVGQVAESNLGDNNKQLTRLFFLLGGETQLSSGLLMGGGRTPCRWRVWFITRNGAATFSEQRSFGGPIMR